MILYKDPLFNFTEIFNQNNGLLIRSNIIDSNGKETKIEPKMRAFPELIDIGVMANCHVFNEYCRKFGVDCYQSQNRDGRDMCFKDFKCIIDQCKNKALQVALGGRGDPNKHCDFIKMLKYCRKNNIIPNLTTTGINITNSEINAMKEFCGAVAVSMYSKLIKIDDKYYESSPQTIDAINKLVKKQIITNVHYVISTKTIDDAILRLEKDAFPQGINAVVFLLYKPVGLAKKDYIINMSDEKTIKFFNLLNQNTYPFKIGFDTCFSPLIKQFLSNYNPKTIEFCESARFSCYISPDMNMYPCSFVQKDEYGVDLNKCSIQAAWLSSNFDRFRNSKTICNCCSKKNDCFGGCCDNLNQLSCVTSIKK